MSFQRLFPLLLLLAGACAPALQSLPPMRPLPEPPAESPMPDDVPAAPAPVLDGALDALRASGLTVPVSGVAPEQIPDSYDAPRDGARLHHAVDILAPRGTPVLASVDGVILRVGTNALGGNVIWASDATGRFAFYYAHLDHWREGLHEGQSVTRGEVIGYVGTTGNAPKDTPHLHFQVVRVGDAQRYYAGAPLNPLPLFRARAFFSSLP